MPHFQPVRAIFQYIQQSSRPYYRVREHPSPAQLNYQQQYQQQYEQHNPNQYQQFYSQEGDNYQRMPIQQRKPLQLQQTKVSLSRFLLSMQIFIFKHICTDVYVCLPSVCLSLPR